MTAIGLPRSSGPGRTPTAVDRAQAAGPTRTGGGAELVAVAVLGVALAAIVNGPSAADEPWFVAINVATLATLVTLGAYLVRRGEPFSGWCFVAAGLSWLLAVVDARIPEWGPLIQWTFSGVTYMALGWAILRYRRPRLTRFGERVFVVAAPLLTVGTAAVTAPFIPPAVLGYPADVRWPLLPVGPGATATAIAVNCVAFLALAVAFCLLMARILRSAPLISRRFLRPMALFGSVLAVGSAVVQVAAMVDPGVVTLHVAVAAVGGLILCLSGSLALTMLLQRTTGSRLVVHLPPVRTPETVAEYLRTVLDDPSAELWYHSGDDGPLLDEHGLPRAGEWPTPDERFRTWIHGSDGTRVALLVGDPLLGDDLLVLDTLTRVLSIVAENARLNVLLRVRVAELSATRTAEQMAFEKAREQFHRNLHDGVQQTIASVRMDLDGLHDVVGTDDAHTRVAEIESKVAVALEQVQNLKRGTDPPELRFGLKPAIERSIAELRMDASCRVSGGDLGVLTLPVYYLVRESLTNVHKHADAGRIEVEVTTDRRTVRVQVRDDGVGGATETARGGISGMRLRAEELGGSLDVATAPDAGTVVTATLPLVAAS